MKINSNDTTEEIQKARPNLKPNSIKQYEAHLKKLQKMYDTDNYDFLSSPSDVMDKLSGKHYTSIRNTLNAVIILLMALNHDNKYDKLIEDYQKHRDKLNNKYLEDQQSGKISDKQKKNFAELNEVQSMIDKMEKEIKEKEIKKKKRDSKMKKVRKKLAIGARVKRNSQEQSGGDVGGGGVLMEVEVKTVSDV